MALVFQFPYREARDGIWGEQTSTLNWCEEDYNITYYCAELINTVTNLVFIYLGIKGIRNVVLYSHAPIFILGFVGYIVVGLGSMAFHSTLKYSMQLADELPMIYTTCIMAYAGFSYRRSSFQSLLIAVGLVSLASWITAYYLYAKNPVFHQTAYTILTLSTICRGIFVTAVQLRPALKQRSPDKCDSIMKDMWYMAGGGVCLFLVGFFIWSMDNTFCPHLRFWRNNYLLLPWGVILEGHAWWHLFTGLAYYLITWRIYLHRCMDGDEDKYLIHWPPLPLPAPQVLPRPGTLKNGATKDPIAKKTE